MNTISPDAKPSAGMLAEPPSVGVPPSTIPAEPLELVEGPKVRTKLRLYAILSALYVSEASRALPIARS